MTQKFRKSFATTLGICSILIILGGCSKQDESVVINPAIQDQEQTTTESQQVFVSSGETLVQNTQKLTINKGCIGCGKCSRIAANTFSMGGYKAQVISQEHISDANVQQAIRDCPVSVIEIVEA